MIDLFNKLLGIKKYYDECTINPKYAFDPDCPEVGQCAAAAICAQRVCFDMGYDSVIYKGIVNRKSHYLLMVRPKGGFLDLTAEQFGQTSFMSNRLPEGYTGFGSCKITDKATKKRAEILYQRFNNRGNE